MKNGDRGLKMGGRKMRGKANEKEGDEEGKQEGEEEGGLVR